MPMVENLKDVLDWGKRIQFVLQVVIFLFSASVLAAVKAMISYYFHIPALWRPPLYLAVAASSLLLFASIGRWWSRRRTDQSEARDALEDVMRQGARTALYDYMECRAIDLKNNLEALWHRWDNAGEKLIHPLNGKLDQLKDFMADGATNLLDERRDFMVLYSHHIMVMKLTFPEFESKTIGGGYPSDRQYFEVRSDLIEHADALGKMTTRTWKKYGNDLDRY
jgi:hypothetical protein